ncbi:MAG: helix-turn-helix transcriptional regulator [Nocardioidaceae bacterium]
MLENIGIAPQHEAVYRALLRAPHSTVAALACSLGREEEAVGAAVRRLEDLGLLTRTTDRPPRLVPARPDAAIGVLVAQRRLELDRVEGSARTLVQEMQVQDQHRPDNLLEVVVGQQAIAARFAQLLTGTTEELLVLDRPPYASEPESSDARVRGLLGDGVTVRGIYSPDSLAVPGAVDEAYSAAGAGESSRMHPQVPMKLAVFDRSTALLPLSVDQMVDSALVVHQCSLLDALVQMFLLLWDQALPVVQPAGDGVEAPLLTLLAAGLKDEAIARQLGLSSRTVGRRAADLMDLLGARTRFQAGVYAERRGLTTPD